MSTIAIVIGSVIAAMIAGVTLHILAREIDGETPDSAVELLT